MTNRLLTEAKSAEHRLTEGAEPERSVAPNRFFKDGVSDIGKSLTHTPLHRPHRTPTHPQPTVHTPPVHPTSSHSTQIPIACRAELSYTNLRNSLKFNDMPLPGTDDA